MPHPKIGTVYLVGAGPGDAGLLTLRGADLLARAEVVVHDTLLNPDLLHLAPASALRIPLGQPGQGRSLSQEAVHHSLAEHARAGRTVVRLKGGDPYVFGRGGEEAEFLAAAGIPFEVVPGVSSFSAVPAAAGIPLTHRGFASAFTVVTGHEDPLKPDAAVQWRNLAQIHGTKVILMGAERLALLASELVAGGLPDSTPVALIRWGTTPRQQSIVGTLGNIADLQRQAGITSPAIAVVGEVVRLRQHLNWFEHRPLFGSRIVVTRPRDQARDFVQRLTELGAETLELPTVRVAPPTERHPMVEALAGLGEYDWVVFSSTNGVTAFFNALLAAFDDIRALGNLRIAAVGPATAARLKDLHLRVDAMPTEFIGRKIADAIAQSESLENLRVLVARAERANPDLCTELESRGAIVDDVAFYQSLPEPPTPGDPADRLAQSGADWITFTSGSTVEHLHQRLNLPDLARRHPALRFASIGPETSKALRALGCSPAIEANPHTLDGLLHALIQATSSRPAPNP